VVRPDDHVCFVPTTHQDRGCTHDEMPCASKVMHGKYRAFKNTYDASGGHSTSPLESRRTLRHG
jgi:hypothetical protein